MNGSRSSTSSRPGSSSKEGQDRREEGSRQQEGGPIFRKESTLHALECSTRSSTHAIKDGYDPSLKWPEKMKGDPISTIRTNIVASIEIIGMTRTNAMI